MPPKLTVVIPYYRGQATLPRLLDSLPSHLFVVVADDGYSEHDDFPNLGERENGRVSVIHLAEKGYFAGAVNAGIRAASPDHDILVLNQDTWFEGPEQDWWLGTLDQYRDRYALIGERIKGEHPAFPHGYVHGTFMFIRRDAWDAVGPLNAEWYPLWGNTAEWQLRAARKGYPILPLEHIPGFRHERQANERFGASIRHLLAQSDAAAQAKLVRTPPLVSVIVLCHNYARFLPDCIHSLIGGPTCLGEMPGQTLQSFEVIIVDDASTDDTPQVAAALADPWMGIRHYRTPRNLGTAAALNFGIERAVGQYITFLSADDMREPGSLEALVRALEAPGEANLHRFAYDDLRWFSGRRRLIVQSGGWWDGKHHTEFDMDRLLQKNTIHAGILYPRRAWEEVGGYPAAMNDGREDWAFNIALGRAGWCGVHVADAGYLYRTGGRHERQTDRERAGYRAKIQALFPELYRGERPMACCGGGRRAATAPARLNGVNAMAKTTPGATGMVQMEYLGGQMSSIWSGPATNIPYRFGKDRRIGWIDQRDAGERDKNGFLNMRQDGQWLFRRYAPPAVDVRTHPGIPLGAVLAVAKPVAPIDAQESVADTVSAETAELAAVAAAVDPAAAPSGLPAPDPAGLTIAEVRALALTTAQWAKVLEAELAGKKRKGVIEWIEQILVDHA